LARGLKPAREKGGRTRAAIKSAAKELFALRGLDKVSVRDIVAAVETRNEGSLYYYFASKDALIEEVIDDFAHERDIVRSRRLDALEAAGAPISIRTICELSVGWLMDPPQDSESALNIQFFLAAERAHRALFTDTGKPGGGSWARSLKYLRDLAPPMAPEAFDFRVACMRAIIRDTIARRVQWAQRLDGDRAVGQLSMETVRLMCDAIDALWSGPCGALDRA